MASMETPSRIWRRIEDIEDRDMPSLPSLPAFDDSGDQPHQSNMSSGDDLNHISTPIHSTPAALSHTATSTIRPQYSSQSSTERFANSIASRSSKSTNTISSRSASSNRGLSLSRGRQSHNPIPDSFDVSMIPSLPRIERAPDNSYFQQDVEETGDESADSVPDEYLPPPDDLDMKSHQDMELEGLSFAEAMQSISRAGSPVSVVVDDATPKKLYDYSVSLRTESHVSPFNKFRNVALRRPVGGVVRTQMRTPSLSRTTPSPDSSRGHSTPGSTTHPLPTETPAPPAIPLPRSSSNSPAILVTPEDEDAFEPSLRDVSLDDLGNLSGDGDPAFEVAQQSHSRVEAQSQSLSRLSRSRSHSRSQGGEDEQEPTFSSASDGATPHAPSLAQLSRHMSPTPLSSPAPSLAFTPTPAIPPRARARFNAPKPPAISEQSESLEQQGDEDEEEAEVPLTPHARRRSFLLSVINTTSRPRLKLPTPHPRRSGTPVSLSSGSSLGTQETPGVNLQKAFAGATPRPPIRRPRTSHPLAQTYIPSELSFNGDKSNASEVPSLNPPTRSRSASLEPEVPAWITTTPATRTPHSGGGRTPSTLSLDAQDNADRQSFISTASSHDLTTHHRANTSFDPVMLGPGAQGVGVGRFNAAKLNAYLHGLNRRLQEENEGLMERLRVLGEREKEREKERRRSLSVLKGVEEDVSAEAWVVEREELEGVVDQLNEDLSKLTREKEGLERAYEEEQSERTRDKERWKERMAEVEQGVEGLVKELEDKAEAAEKRAKALEDGQAELFKDVERRLREVEGERDAATARAQKAEEVLESGKELGGELREANERVSQVLSDLRNASAQIQELEDEVIRSDGRVDELEKALSEEKVYVSQLQGDAKEWEESLAEAQRHITDLEEELTQSQQDLQVAKAYTQEAEDEARAAVDAVESLEAKLSQAQLDLEAARAAEAEAREQRESSEEEAIRVSSLAKQTEEALEEAEKKMWEDEEAMARLKGEVASLHSQLDRDHRSSSRHVPDDTRPQPGPTDADMEALEAELDDANREIGRLTALLNQSPARKAVDKARDVKIEMLEAEKEELAERVRALRSNFEMATPHKLINAPGISPIHRQVLSMSIRAPKTPGGPLRDMSWLNNTTIDPSIAPLVAEVSRLQKELDRANESIDDKLDKLQESGLDVVSLTKLLEDARSRIVALEKEIAALSRKEDRRVHQLRRARCQKCNVKVDLRGINEDESLELSRSFLPSNPPTPATKTSEKLRASLEEVNLQLDSMKKQWAAEKQQLLGEKAVLQDAARRLNVQVKDAQDEVKRVLNNERASHQKRTTLQGELDKAKGVISDLEADLKVQRAQLRGLTGQHEHAEREKQDVLRQLQRTESDMDDVKTQLINFRQQNTDLECELRENANADQKARLLEAKVAKNLETIEQLRQERTLLTTDHKDLQKRFSEITEHVNKLRVQHSTSQTSHDNRRHQLDLHLAEIEDLRRALSEQAGELERTEMERNRAKSEKSAVARTVEALEVDLKQLRRDAERLGRDLGAVMGEKAMLLDDVRRMERGKKQSQTQIRLLTEQLDKQREKTVKARGDLEGHICASNDEEMVALRTRHNLECKGLIVQIRYLKAKFTREAGMRLGLAYQKQYLLVVLSSFEKSEKGMSATLARIGYPAPSPVPRRKSLRSVARAIIFISRVKRASEEWQVQTASREAISAALQEVRRRRVVGLS